MPWVLLNATPCIPAITGLPGAACTNLQMAGDNTTFVLIASRDSATIQSKNYLQNDDVKALIMHTSFKDLHENNNLVHSLTSHYPCFSSPSLRLPFAYSLLVSKVPVSELLFYTRVLCPITQYQTADGRRHIAWLKQDAGIKTKAKLSSRSEPISNAGFAKVVTMIPQIQRWSHPFDCGGKGGTFVKFGRLGFNEVEDRSFAKPLVERPIDVAFAGVVHSNGRDELGIGEHRMQAIKAIEKLGKKRNLTVEIVSHPLGYNEYVKLLRKSKASLTAAHSMIAHSPPLDA